MIDIVENVANAIGVADALRYKSMFDDAVAQHNAQMERAERAEAEVARLTAILASGAST